MKGTGTGRQRTQPIIKPPPTTTINIRDEDGGKRSKQVSAYRDSQDRSIYKPHQGKKEKLRRMQHKAKADD